MGNNNMNEIVYNNYDLVAFDQDEEHSTGITRRKLRARLIIDGKPDVRS